LGCVAGPNLCGVSADFPGLRRPDANSIAFITFIADIHKILEHIGVAPEAPRITPARGPPLWDDSDAQESQEQGEGVEAEPDWDAMSQSPPDCPDDQRTAW